MTTKEIVSALESVLFAGAEPLSTERLVSVIGVSEEEVMTGLEGLAKRYEASESGLALVRNEGFVQIATRSSNAAYIESFAKSAMQESLSKAALEVLAVIAYRGPIARAEIEAVRGVNCSVTVRNLLMRGLIDRYENADDSRGYLYSVSFPFLRELGLSSVAELPDYETLTHDERLLSVATDAAVSGETNDKTDKTVK